MNYLSDSEYETYGLEPATPESFVAAASSLSSSPWPAIDSRRRSSTSPRREGSQRLDASRTAVTGGGTAEGRVTTP